MNTKSRLKIQRDANGDPTNRLTRKMQARTIAESAAVLVVAVAAARGYEIPTEISVAAVALLGHLVGFYTRSRA